MPIQNSMYSVLEGQDLPEEKVIRWYETYKAQETIDNE